MDERFKIRCISRCGIIYFSETTGEVVFTKKGIRFFAHQYSDDHFKGWRVSCAMSGVSAGQGRFKEDAIKMAKENLHYFYDEYLRKLKKRQRAVWRPKAIGSTE